MLAEWIRILGLDGNDPPWEGEPGEIRATVYIDNRPIRVRILKIKYSWRKMKTLVEILDISFEDQTDLAAGSSRLWVSIKSLSNLIVIY